MIIKELHLYATYREADYERRLSGVSRQDLSIRFLSVGDPYQLRGLRAEKVFDHVRYEVLNRSVAEEISDILHHGHLTR